MALNLAFSANLFECSTKMLLISHNAVLYIIINYTAIQFYVLNDSPHPQRSVSLGFLNINVDENCSFL